MRFTRFMEMFGSFSYSLPEDKEQQLYDFYMLSYLRGLVPADARPDFRDKTGYDISRFSTVRPDKHELDNDDKINVMLDEVAKALLPQLKEGILDAVFFSICAEARHVFALNDSQSLLKLVGSQYADGFKSYARRLVLLKNKISADLARKPEIANQDIVSQNSDYMSSYYAAIKSGMSRSDFVNMMRTLFLKASWGSQYGGKAWASICNGWLRLDEAKGERNLVIWIDHVYDLQHNTDTVFNKLASYAKGGSYSWLASALNHKASIKSPHEIIDKVSPALKRLALRAIKAKSGQTYEDFLKTAPANAVAAKESAPRRSLKDELIKKLHSMPGPLQQRIARILMKYVDIHGAESADNIIELFVPDFISPLTKSSTKKSVDDLKKEILQQARAEQVKDQSLAKALTYIPSLDFMPQTSKEGLEKTYARYGGYLPTMPVKLTNVMQAFMPLRSNNLIQAVKLFREMSNYSLSASKASVLLMYARYIIDNNVATTPAVVAVAGQQSAIKKLYSTYEGTPELKYARIILSHYRQQYKIASGIGFIKSLFPAADAIAVEHAINQDFKAISFYDAAYDKLKSMMSVGFLPKPSDLSKSGNQLEQLLKILGGNLAGFVSSTTIEMVKHLIESGKAIEAIKLVRTLTGWGLPSAKALALHISALEASHLSKPPS